MPPQRATDSDGPQVQETVAPADSALRLRRGRPAIGWVALPDRFTNVQSGHAVVAIPRPPPEPTTRVPLARSRGRRCLDEFASPAPASAAAPHSTSAAGLPGPVGSPSPAASSGHASSDSERSSCSIEVGAVSPVSVFLPVAGTGAEQYEAEAAPAKGVAWLRGRLRGGK